MGVQRWTKALTWTLKTSTDHSLALVYSVGFPLHEHLCGSESSREDHPFLRAFTSRKTQSQILWKEQKSFHQLPGLTDEWFTGEGFLATAKMKEDAALRAGRGPCWSHPSVSYSRSQTESIYSNVYSALMESEQRHYQICLSARGFLNLPGPRMGLFPANLSAFPGSGVAVVAGLWMSCHQWGPIFTQTMFSYWGRKVKGLLEAGKQIHS